LISRSRSRSASGYPRPLDLKCPPFRSSFVDSVETSDSYAAIGATLIIQENFQPTFEVRKVIEHLLDNAEKSEQFTEELDGNSTPLARTNAS